MLSNLNVRLPTNESEKESLIKIVGATRWDILVLWLQEPADAGKKFEQYCEVVSPDGSVLTKNRTEFTITERTHRIITHVQGFPISRTAGEHRLKLYLRAEDEPERREVATYPIAVQITLDKST